jgi:hypothetical protein
VIRAVVVFAVAATPAAFWHLDVEPLSTAWLRINASRAVIADGSPMRSP